MRTMFRVAMAITITSLALPVAAETASAAASPKVASPTGWVPTATKAMTKATWPGLVDGSPVTTTPMTVTLALPLRNAAAVKAMIKAHETVSSSVFESTYDPTATTAAAVTAYLTQTGFTKIKVSTDRVLVTATAPAAKVASAFHTALDAVTYDRKSYVANVLPAMMPARLSGSVTAVLGLTTLPIDHVNAAPASSCGVGVNPTPTMSTLCTIEPPDYQSTYDAKGTPTGSKTPIAIFAEGDLTQVATDYAQERSDLGLPSIAFNVIDPPADTVARTDTSGADEFDLDTQSSTGMAQTVSRLDVYDASSLDDGPLADAFNAFVTSDADKAGSASFGGCETLSEASGALATDDAIFMQAAAQGQTIFASSGDTGTACLGASNGVPAGVPGVEYPASSPYVVGVGGTTLLPDDTTFAYGSELAWAGSGGGESLFETAPSYQANDTAPYGELPFKTVPDISNVADPNNGGAWVDVDGAYEGVGGTSLASPVSLGEWARIESYCSDSLGYAAPVLYSLAGTSAIHDVIAGDSGYYPASPGYDLATGLGTLDVAQVEAHLAGNSACNTSGSPAPSLPEAPLTAGLPIIAVVIGFGAWVLQRRRRGLAARMGA